MISIASFAPRNCFAMLVSCIAILMAVVGCRRSETATSSVMPSPPQTQPVESDPVTQHIGTAETTMPPEDVFKRALWRRPAPEDRILHAERREWTKDTAQGVARWEWFLAVEPGPALKAWLREQNPFSIHPVGNAEAPVITGAPEWFPADYSDYIVHTGAATASLLFLWSRKGNTLYASGSGTGFAPGTPEPAASPTALPTISQGRLPQTGPPTPPKP